VTFSPKPPWLKVRAPGGDTYNRLKSTFRALDLHTVCEEARCPNVGECWREGTATVMLLGDTCTRGCRFCAVTTGNPRGAVDVREPEHVARAIAKLELQYVVLTMVDRDDVLDGGADHVARTIERIRALRPDILIEALVGDFQGHLSYVDVVVDSAPDVFAHNIEVVRRITRTVRDVRCSYDQSLSVLARAKERAPSRITKSSIMVGIGETDDEVVETLRDLRAAKVDIVTLGQYLRPSPKHHEVLRFVPPETFDGYAAAAREMGFLYAASGPLTRSSYKAAEVFVRSVLKPGDGEGAKALLEERLETARREAALAERAFPASTGELAARTAVTLLRDAAGSVGLIEPSSLVRRLAARSRAHPPRRVILRSPVEIHPKPGGLS
jgi:lipoyl synthase